MQGRSRLPWAACTPPTPQRCPEPGQRGRAFSPDLLSLESCPASQGVALPGWQVKAGVSPPALFLTCLAHQAEPPGPLHPRASRPGPQVSVHTTGPPRLLVPILLQTPGCRLPSARDFQMTPLSLVQGHLVRVTGWKF